MRREVGVSDEPYMPIQCNGCAYSRPSAEGYTSVMQNRHVRARVWLESASG